MRTVSVRARIPVDAAAAWAVVRTGGAMDRWVPAISACHVDGDGVGARRVCVIDAQELEETIETVDDESRLFQYRIRRQNLLPVRNVVGTIHLADTGPDACDVLWFANFELMQDEAWPAVRDGLEAIYRSGIEGLGQHVLAGGRGHA
jgi:hypothetical protein